MGKLVLLIFLLFSVINAKANLIENPHEIGWFWYKDSKFLEQDEPVKRLQLLLAQTEDPSQKIEIIKQITTALLHKAIIYPTPENAANFAAMQNYDFQLSEKFANALYTAVMRNPSLDNTINFPTNHVPRQIYLAQQEEKAKQVLNELAKEHGFFFSFKVIVLIVMNLLRLLSYLAKPIIFP